MNAKTFAQMQETIPNGTASRSQIIYNLTSCGTSNIAPAPGRSYQGPFLNQSAYGDFSIAGDNLVITRTVTPQFYSLT